MEIFSPGHRSSRILSGKWHKEMPRSIYAWPSARRSAKDEKKESENQTRGSNAEERPPRRQPLQFLRTVILAHSSTGVFCLVGKWRGWPASL